MSKDAAAAITPLTSHAKKRDTIEFSEVILHDRLRFGKGEVVRFTGEHGAAAAAYFDVAFNGTEFSDKEPTREIGDDELNFDPKAPGATIDPNTVIKGREGVTDGTSVLQVASGNPHAGSGNAPLEVDDVVSEGRG